jgi:hypothetical protein
MAVAFSPLTATSALEVKTETTAFFHYKRRLLTYSGEKSGLAVLIRLA